MGGRTHIVTSCAASLANESPIYKMWQTAKTLHGMSGRGVRIRPQIIYLRARRCLDLEEVLPQMDVVRSEEHTSELQSPY